MSEGIEHIFCPMRETECLYATCPWFAPEFDNCKVILIFNKLLLEGEMPLPKTPVTRRAMQPPTSLQVGFGKPDISSIEWFIGKGQDRYGARPTDEFAYAFVFKYDAQAQQATDVIRDENVELVNWLKKSGPIEIDGFKYSISKNGVFLNRNMVE